MTTLSRRTFLSSSVAIGAAAAGCATAPRGGASTGIEDWRAVYLSEAEPATRPTRSLIRRNPPAWLDQPAAARETPRWRDGADSPNFAHLSTPYSDAMFEFGPDDLDLIAAWNRYDVGVEAGPILFGLRGCRLVDAAPADEAGFRRRLLLAEAQPDHRNFNCVIGVWDRGLGDGAGGRLWATNASTVPNVNYMYGQTKLAMEQTWCNMLPTGYYGYSVGTHRAGSSYPQQGAFRLATTTPVLRSLFDLAYTVDDTWDDMMARSGAAFTPLNAADNIHAAIFDDSADIAYSSAGCQVLPGRYEIVAGVRRPVGAWSELRIAAGLADIPKTEENGRVYRYLLATGREALIAAAGGLDGAAPAMTRLRFGSSGPIVAALQEALRVEQTSLFDHKTFWAFLRLQRCRRQAARRRRPRDGAGDRSSRMARSRLCLSLLAGRAVSAQRR